MQKMCMNPCDVFQKINHVVAREKKVNFNLKVNPAELHQYLNTVESIPSTYGSYPCITVRENKEEHISAFEISLLTELYICSNFSKVIKSPEVLRTKYLILFLQKYL